MEQSEDITNRYIGSDGIPVKESWSVKTLAVLGSRVLIVENENTGEWSLPGGRLKEGETKYECLEREFFEETALLGTDLSVVRHLADKKANYIWPGDGIRRIKHQEYFLSFLLVYDEYVLGSSMLKSRLVSPCEAVDLLKFDFEKEVVLRYMQIDHDPFTFTKADNPAGVPLSDNYGDELVALAKRITGDSRVDLGTLASEVAAIQMVTADVGRRCNVICLEGERGSGKSTQVRLLQRDYGSRLGLAPARTPNPAWQLLQAGKRNMYFDLPNPAACALLFAADLWYRLREATECSCVDSVVFDRYIYSLFVIHTSLFTANGLSDLDSQEFLWHLVRPMLREQVVFLLKVSESVSLERLLSLGKRPSPTDRAIMMRNTLGFERLIGRNIIRIDSCLPAEEIHRIIVDALKVRGLL